MPHRMHAVWFALHSSGALRTLRYVSAEALQGARPATHQSSASVNLSLRFCGFSISLWFRGPGVLPAQIYLQTYLFLSRSSYGVLRRAFRNKR